jgi:hypothetical protein
MVGGKREGAGRKPTHPLLKKEMISIKLPRWLIDRLSEETASRAVMIETALRNQHGWTPPDIDG